MMTFLEKITNLFFKPIATDHLKWSSDNITDAWFDAHFNYATDAVAEWLGSDRLTKTVTLDFGCGDGITALGLILRYQALRVHGVDISQTHLGLEKLAQKQIDIKELPRNLNLFTIQAGETIRTKTKYENIISWSTFEHIEERYIPSIIQNLHSILEENGLFFMQINPLYYSPHGSHLSRFKLPAWAHLSWSNEEIEKYVLEYSDEIPQDEIEENFHKNSFLDYKNLILKEYRQLNKLKAIDFINRFKDNGFEIIKEQYGTVSEIPNEKLIAQFSEKDLITDEIRLLMRKL